MNRYLVEFIGTLFVAYIIAATQNPLAVGAAYAFAILIGGPISGGHFNPAISMLMASSGNLEVSQLLPYVLSQIAGALIALEIFRRVSA